MPFQPPLVRGTLLRRYKRFLADVLLDDGREITAHCPNPGSMLSLVDGTPQTVWLTPHDDPKRKLQWTLELLQVDAALVCVNTMRPNLLAQRAIETGLQPTLEGYETIRREVKYGEKSRIDLLLQSSGRPDCYVEVKGVTMSRQPGVLEFPDSVTSRGAKHLDELANMVRQGHRAVMFYLAMRDDGRSFRLAGDIDPAYATAFRRARDAGVEAVAQACVITPEAIYPKAVLPVDID
ncbi:MAG: DNA/RNA nuclease SfsA [Minwuia sp.]|nr:DNA/RNA nuclease SfsA [Minwuia sp.]